MRHSMGFQTLVSIVLLLDGHSGEGVLSGVVRPHRFVLELTTRCPILNHRLKRRFCSQQILHDLALLFWGLCHVPFAVAEGLYFC